MVLDVPPPPVAIEVNKMAVDATAVAVDSSSGDPVYHGFYQWVGMVLFGQSICFYIPHFLWKSCEGKRIERLVSG